LPSAAAFLLGDDFYLRPLRESDADGSWPSWLNDQNLTHYMSNGTWPVTREDQIAYFRASVGSRSMLVVAVCLKSDDRHIGNIVLNSIDLIHRKAELGIILGDREESHRGVGWKAIRLLCGHGFDRLNLHKVWARIEDGNSAALKAFTRAGFEKEASLKEEILHHGAWRNSLYLGLVEERYRRLTPGVPA